MAVFNFSNMQGTKNENKVNQYIPVEFRQDNSIDTPDNANSRIDNVNSRIDNANSRIDNANSKADNKYMPGGSNGFIDETGTWNDGSSLNQYKTSDTQWNQSITGQLINSNAYKKYFYNREEVLKEAKTMAGALNIPENVILKDADTLAKTREIYNFKQRQLDKDEVFKAYPELSRIAEKSDTDAAIALHNLKNVKETRDIFEAMKVGLELDELNSERGRIGFKGMNGGQLTEDEHKRIAEIEKRMDEMPKLPGLFEDPLASIAGGTAQTGRLMLRNFFNGQKMGAYGAGFGAILGATAAGTATLGTGTAAGAIAGARLGYSIGTRIGMAQDMYDEVAGNNYLDFKKYTDKNGKQLLTDNQARVYGATAAAVETFIEYSNADKIIEVIKGTGAEGTIKEIIKAAKNNTELYAMLTAFVKKGIVNTGKVAVPETIEEGVQEASNRIITNIMALNNPGGDIPVYSTQDILAGAVESMWAALPASIGLGAAAQGASTMRMGREIAKVLSLKSEQDKANYKNANGISMLRQLKEYMVKSELNKKNPELQKEVLTEQLADSGMETLAVDTDMVLNQQGGYELLKEVADKAGISEEVFNQIVETRSDMTINTAVYAQTILPDELAAKLEDYITFDAAGECIARNRQYAGRIRRLADELLEGEAQKRAETLATFLDSNFRNDQEREVAEAVLMRFPDNPAEGVKELRKQIQGQIDAMLAPVLERMNEGMGNGVSIIYVDDEGNPTTEEYAARGIRASNNEGWYSQFYKDYGRAPTKQELKDIARDILTGRSDYQVLGWEYQPGMEEYYEQNREHLEKLDESMERLNSLAPRLEKIDPGELTITEGLSKEGYEVYKMTAEKLLSSASKQARTAARMSAILYARMADRMAELYREAGYKKYTALDFAKRITLDTTGQGSVGGGFNQWNANNDIVIGDKVEFDKQINEVRNKYINTPEWMKAPNGQPTTLTEQQWLAIRTPAFIERYGDWINLYQNSFSKEQMIHSYETIKDIISGFRNETFYNESEKIAAKLSKKGRGKVVSSVAIRLSTENGVAVSDHFTAIANMKQLFNSAMLVERRADKYGDIKSIDLYASYCNINNKPLIVYFTVKNLSQEDNSIYTIQLTKIEKLTGILPRSAKKRSSATVSLSDINITQLAKKYKNIHSYIGENGEPDVNKLLGISLEQRDYNAVKQAQLDIINQYNPMHDDIHLGIRKIEDILSADEALNVTQEQLDNYEIEGYSYPDFSLKDGQKALKTGKIRMYSSKPFTLGCFISPSKMMAQDYAGDGKVYSKVIPLEDVAFINGDEGQYAPISYITSFEQRAYHGTKYNFNSFDLGKIGDGVGDQVHGWGLYFAQNRETSENYKDVLGVEAGQITINGKTYIMGEYGRWITGRTEKSMGETIFPNTPLNIALNALDANKNVPEAINDLDTRITRLSQKENNETDITNLKAAIDILQNGDAMYYNPSTVFEVDIPDNDLLLDEDKKYSEQPSRVKESLDKLFSDLFDGPEGNAFLDNINKYHNEYLNDLENYDNLRGKGIYELLAAGLGNDKAASLKLNEYGIKGITYIGKKDGRCFVVFDDNSISIIEKYNQAVGMLAKTSNIYSLDKAQDMDKQNVDMKTIFKETGWYKGVDNLWRREIPDNLDRVDATMMPEDSDPVELWKIYDNPELYEAYPWLADVAVYTRDLKDKSYKGYTDGDNIVLNKMLMQSIITETVTINGNEYTRTRSKDGMKSTPFMDSKGQKLEGDIETAVNLGFGLDNTFKREKAIAEVESLIDTVENTIATAQRTDLWKVAPNFITEREQELNSLKDALKFIQGAKISEKVTTEEFDSESTRKCLAGTLIHEIQHIIQQYEGFASGGNVENIDNQIQGQIFSYQMKAESIHPMAFDYYCNYEYFIKKQLEYDMDLITKEELDKIEHEHVDYFNFIPEYQRKRIRRIYDQMYFLEEQQKNTALDNFDKYLNLAGEQESRAATRKAEINTEIERLKETANITDDEIINKYIKDIPEEDKPRLYELIAIDGALYEHHRGIKELPAEEAQKLANRQDELCSSFPDNHPYWDISSDIWERDIAQSDLKELQNKLDRMALEGVDKITAIVVFNGSDVGGFNIEGKVVGLKGQTTIKPNGERVISLFKAADQSTFMHESAHLFLAEMIALAKTPNAPQQLHKDLQTIASWANWKEEQITEYVGTYLEKEFKQLDSEIKEAMAKGSAIHNGQEMTLEQLKTIWMQERFARGFENYLKQGKAPTAAIQSVFSKFKAWLSNIYRSFKQLGGAPTKEVRAVMDRMIATQDEVEIEMKKRGVNDFVKNGGMDYLAEDSQALYNRMVERAKEEAEAKVLKVAMKDVREDLQRQQEEFIAQAEKDYREELSTEPVFMVMDHIKNKPGVSTSVVCQGYGLTLEEYVDKLKEYGGSIDAAVETYMKELRKDAENNPVDEAYIREKAEEAVQGSYYRKMVTALELNAFENIAKAQRTLNRKIAKELGEVDAKEASEAMKKLTAKEKMEAGLRAVRDVAEGHYRDYVNYVKSKLETMPISDANNYKMWRRKSQEAADMASHAMTKGNWEQAVNCKKQQLIYDLFADEAVKGSKYVTKLEQTLARRQVTMSNNLNMPADERYVYNHLLFVFGFVKKDAAQPPEYKGFTSTLMKRDETLECPFVGEDGMLDLPDWILSAGSGTQARAAGHSDLTMQQLKDLAQLMKVIYKTGMEADKLRTAKDIHGNTVSLPEAVSQIARESEQRVLLKNDKDITGAQGTTRLEDALNAANAAHVALLKPETIFRQLGDSAMRYIYNPLKAAADKELKLSGEMQKDLTKLFNVYSKKEMHEMRTVPKYRLGTSMLTKERLIMLGLNWGTSISMQRVMAGHNVSSYEVNEVLSNLDQRDWELITGIWALYEKHWPELQAVEARLTGAVLEKQEAFPFTILGKDGSKYNIPGGYFPLKYDATKNAAVAERAEDVAKQATMAGFALGIGRSMTKERSQGRVALPLDLRFDIISKTLADEIHLISFREPVRDARRIILNDDFTAIIKGIYGINTVSMLRKWSADCWALEPVPQTGFERVMSMLRGNMTMAVLGYRTMTAILNVLNIAPMAHYLGGPAEAMRAMKRFYARPREMYAYITQESVFMAERAQTMDVNIREAIQKGTTADMIPGYKAVQENAFRIIAMTDLSIAMPLWLREYEKKYQESLDNGLKPESAKRDAVLAGDAAVRRVFGSSQKIDLSAVQRGSEIMKCMTMYYSYFSTLYNALAYMIYETRQKVLGAKIRSGSWKKAVAENKKQLLKGLAPLANGLLMWILIPSVMEALLRPIADDDEDKWAIDKLALKSTKNVVSNLVGGIPVLRDAVPYLMARAFNEPQYSMGTLPAYNTVEQLNKVIQSIASDKKTIYDVARESMRLTGTFVGFSATLSDGLATTIEWAGTDFEASIPEYMKAVVFDRKLKKK